MDSPPGNIEALWPLTREAQKLGKSAQENRNRLSIRATLHRCQASVVEESISTYWKTCIDQALAVNYASGRLNLICIGLAGSRRNAK